MYRLIGKKAGELIYITDEELQHLKVLRLKPTDKVEINDLQGNIFEGEILEISKKEAKIKPIKKLDISEQRLKITLFLGMPNQLSKVDDLIEPISQLGVYKLVPVITKRSAVKEKDIIRKKEKWEKIALNSIKQCKRLFPVIVENPVNIHKINQEGLKFVFYEKEKVNNLKTLEFENIEEIAVFIGPEGGFEEEEIQMLKNKGFITLSLGDYILRMETAVVVSLCQINFKFL